MYKTNLTADESSKNTKHDEGEEGGDTLILEHEMCTKIVCN
jgi:hypothetical protein